jgi:E3 ubiquitin-protein ligase UBR7
LVELFNKRNFVCDCGTTRMPSTSPCTLREDPNTGRKGVHSQEAAPGNKYNHNFRNQFCGCGEKYDPHQEKGTMFQCLGLGSVETGGCGEDWWHPECLIGLPRDWYKNLPSKKSAPFGEDGAVEGAVDGLDENGETPLPPGFPAEEDFQQLICYKCIESTPWLKRYAGTPGFLPPVFRNGGIEKPAHAIPEEPATVETPNQEDNSKKRKADDDEPAQEEPLAKRTKEDGAPAKDPEPSTLITIKEDDPSPNPSTITAQTPTTDSSKPKHTSLPSTTPEASFSLFLLENFHDRLCRCAECFPKLAPFPQLREEEETYEPPLSDDGNGAGAGSTGTGSLLERGEAALSNVDRVRAIEGAMIYNHLRDKVKDFLKPFAESGQAVSAEDIKGYFEKLRGDEQGIKDAAGRPSAVGDGGGDTDGDNRREQNGASFLFEGYSILEWN